MGTSGLSVEDEDDADAGSKHLPSQSSPSQTSVMEKEEEETTVNLTRSSDQLSLTRDQHPEDSHTAVQLDVLLPRELSCGSNHRSWGTQVQRQI